jgi:hypothetical protein
LSSDVNLLMGDTQWVVAHVYDERGRRRHHSELSRSELRWTDRDDEPYVVERVPDRFFRNLVPEEWDLVGPYETGARLRGSGIGEAWVVARYGDAADSIRVTVHGRAVTLDTVALGAHQACGLTAAGDAYCWGMPQAMLAGTANYPALTYAPAPVGGGVRFQEISVGGQFACGVTSARKAYCWGNNHHSVLLGAGGPVTTADPVPVAGDLHFAEVSAGSAHTCGVTESGALYCWGMHHFGQMGIGDEAPQTCGGPRYPCSPAPVRVASDLTFRHVAAGRLHTCAVTVQGEPYCWGNNSRDQLGHESEDICEVPPGSYHCSRTPRPVEGAPELTTLALGAQHTCGLTAEGRTFCWGQNESGELGTGDREDSVEPRLLSGDLRFRQITLFCGVTFEGEAWCWGPSDWGANGTSEHDRCPGGPCNLTPVRVSGGHTFRSISRSPSEVTCGVSTDGTYCWGRNLGTAMLGIGTRRPHSSDTPLRVYDGR